MQAVVVYESMFGNTHVIADAIGRSLKAFGDVAVVPVAEAGPELLAGADLVVVGGPTHVHGMSRTRTREAAVTAAHKPDSQVIPDPHAQDAGLREWFDGLGEHHCAAAAFDTRAHGPGIFTGRASRGIKRHLHHHGFALIAEPESFMVSGKDTHLDPGEVGRAAAWGETLGRTASYRVVTA